jgi:uncharacterized protein YcfJ
MNPKLKFALGITALFLATNASAQITFYEGEAFRGRAFRTDRPLSNLDRTGFNDRASSVIVDRGSWEVCTDARFEGRCVLLRRGSYDSLGRMGIDNRISSARPVDERRPARPYVSATPEPLPVPTYEYRRRPGERMREVPVTSVRAVMGPPEQRCWVERQQVVEDRGDRTAGAALGAIIGGIIGHQVGGGHGKDAATAAGAIAGAVIGSERGRNDGPVVTDRDVQRCKTVASGQPAYWDVTYVFRGVEHRVQMSAPPGPTILVNSRGEPRQ